MFFLNWDCVPITWLNVNVLLNINWNAIFFRKIFSPTIKQTPLNGAPCLCTINPSDHSSNGLYFNHLFSHQYLVVDCTLSDERDGIYFVSMTLLISGTLFWALETFKVVLCGVSCFHPRMLSGWIYSNLFAYVPLFIFTTFIRWNQSHL